MASVKVWFRRLRTLLWTALALMIIAAAVLVGIGKLLMPYSERYKPRLEAVLSEQFNQPVRVDAFTGEWKAFGPRISLEGVNLLGGAEEGDALAIAQAALDIKPLNALISGRPIYSFRIIGADLELVRFADGRLELSGLGVSGRRLGEEQDGSALSNLARVGEVRLQDSRFGFRDEAQDVHLQLVGIDGRLQLRGERLALDVQAGLSDARRALVLGDLAVTALATLEDGGGIGDLQFHLEAGELMLDELADQLPDHRLKPVSGRVNAQLWGSWAPGRPQEIVGVVDIRDTGIDTGDKQLLLDHLNARLNWRWRDKTQWRIDLADVRVEENERDWTAPRIAVERNLEGCLGVWVSADYLEAEFPLEVTQVIMNELGRRWPKAAPTAGRGPVSDFDLVINDRRKLTATSGSFENLEVLEWDPWPLAAGLSGRIDLAYGEGSLRFGGEDVTIRWDRNFRAPLVADLVDCELEILWTEDNDWQVDALPCPIVSEHLEGEARLRFVRDEGKPRVDVNASLRRAELGQLHDYWPRSVMSPKVTDWLRRSISAAQVADARFVMQGDMDRFPFRDGSGVLRVTANVTGGQLDYAPAWPPANGVDARLEIREAAMVLEGRIGDLAGGEVQAATARIDDLKAPVLALDYRSDTRLAALQAFLEASPLLDDTDLELARLGLEGPAVTHGRLTLPLGDSPGELALTGVLEVSDARFTEASSGFSLEAIAGALNYSRDGFFGPGLDARLAGWPASLELEGAWGTERPFGARLGGHFPVSLLVTESPLSADPLLARMSGEADWRLSLEARRPVAGEDSELWFEIASDLEGVVLDLPAPLAKPASERWPLSLSYPIVAPDAVMRASLDGRAALALELQAPPAPEAPAEAATEGLAATPDAATEPGRPPRVRRGALALGAGPATLPADGQFGLGGEAPVLDLDQWLSVIVDYARADRYPGGLTLRASDLHADTLVLMNRAFEDVTIGLAYDGAHLEASFDGAAIAGDVRYTSNEDGSHALSAQMDRLLLPEPLDTGMSMDTDPTALPEMHFLARELRFMGLDFGETQIEAYPIANGLRIESVESSSPQLTFQARGDWVVQEGGSRSDFDIVLTSESLGALVNAMDLSSVLEGGQTMVRYDAWWPGPPAAFELARLNGQMSFSVIDGRILNADPGAGRVLGLMSVGALPRRLALDFSDVFESGFGFDQANGTIRLDSGTAYTDDFILESTAAQLAITGSSDLQAKEFDYLMTVRPGVSQALPVIGAIAAGPAGAAAGLALQGLLRQALGDAAEARYEITGPWSDPVVERLPATTSPPPENSTAQAETTEGT